MREDYYAGLEDRYFLTFDQAKQQKTAIDFDAVPPAPTPNKLGVTVIDYVTLEDVVPYIDWVSFVYYVNLCGTGLPNLTHPRPILLIFLFIRILSSKHGSFEAVIPIADTLKSSTTKLLVLKLRNCLMMPKS